MPEFEKKDLELWKRLYLITLVLGIVIVASGLLSPNLLSRVFYTIIGILKIGSSLLGLKVGKNPERVIIISWLLFAFTVSFLLIVPGPVFSAPEILMLTATLSAIVTGIIGLYGILGVSKKYKLPVAP